MSNEFVRVPRVPTDEMKEAADGLGFVFSHGDEEWNGIISADMAEEIYQVMIDAKPAEQHQSKSVTLPERMTHADTRDHDAPVEIHNATVAGWNACLDAVTKLGPLYTHADPGEVERLRAELETVKANSKRLAELDDAFIKGQSEKLRSITAQLAERDALLSDTLKFMDSTNSRYPIPYELRERMRSVLSASAEPSAPKCGNCGAATGHACNDKGCGYLESGNGEPSAPVERDERAMTKAFNDWAFYKKGEAIGRMDGQQAALEGFIAGADWQARAALERKP